MATLMSVLTLQPAYSQKYFFQEGSTVTFCSAVTSRMLTFNSTKPSEILYCCSLVSVLPLQQELPLPGFDEGKDPCQNATGTATLVHLSFPPLQPCALVFIQSRQTGFFMQTTLLSDAKRYICFNSPIASPKNKHPPPCSVTIMLTLRFLAVLISIEIELVPNYAWLTLCRQWFCLELKPRVERYHLHT